MHRASTTRRAPAAFVSPTRVHRGDVPSCSDSAGPHRASPTRGRRASGPRASGRARAAVRPARRATSRARTCAGSSRRSSLSRRAGPSSSSSSQAPGPPTRSRRHRDARLPPTEDIVRPHRGAAAFAYPVALRGLRDADRRGDGLRDAGRLLHAPVARRGFRRRCRRADPESAEAIAAGIERALVDRESLVARPGARRRFTWRACGEASPSQYS